MRSRRKTVPDSCAPIISAFHSKQWQILLWRLGQPLTLSLIRMIQVFLWIGTASLSVRKFRSFGIPVRAPLDNVNI
jgi:hypothetical protein